MSTTRTTRTIAFSRSDARSGRGRRSASTPERSYDLSRYRAIIPEFGRFLDAVSRPEPTVLRVRAGRIEPEALVERLERRGFRLAPLSGLPSFYSVEDGPSPVSMTLEHWLGLFYVQQASTGVAAPALAAGPGERVLDLCSAPGGKTTHLAELMKDRGCLVASEISESRIRGLLGNIYRLGHTNVLVVSGDGREFPTGALFDRVLVDAPCSGEGTLRRRAGRMPRRSASFAAYVTRAQRELLLRAIELTRPGGTILYVTCTFAPEENEAVVSEILESAPVEIDPLALPVPHARGVTEFEGRRFDPRVEGAARIYPHHLDSGGLFLARLRKLDDATPAAASGGDGWSPVPAAFPGESMDREEAQALIALGMRDLSARFGVDAADLAGLDWIVRGGRVWLHSASEWPLASWDPGGWRGVSLGIRALGFDTRGRPRPTNDFLRRISASVRASVYDVDEQGLRALLGREALPVGEATLGPCAIRFGGEVVGRGAATTEGLKSEMPKARAGDLLRVLDADRGA